MIGVTEPPFAESRLDSLGRLSAGFLADPALHVTPGQDMGPRIAGGRCPRESGTARTAGEAQVEAAALELEGHGVEGDGGDAAPERALADPDHARAAPRAQQDHGVRGVAAGHDAHGGEVRRRSGESGSEEGGQHVPDYTVPAGRACYSPRAPHRRRDATCRALASSLHRPRVRIAASARA